METIFELTGRTAFLNGTKGLHCEMDEPIFKKMISHNMDAIIIDNLFEDTSGLKKLDGVSNLVLFTTGQNGSKLDELRDAFRALSFVPKVVVFLTESTAEAFVYTARELKKHGTEFYFCFDKKTLFEGWI